MSRFLSSNKPLASTDRTVRIINNHEHPMELAAAPDALSRRASATFTAIANGNTFTLGSIVYTFVAALGSPAANNVQIRNQGNLSDNVKKLAQATQGVTDATNIAYGSGTNPNPTAVAYWTSQRFSLGSTTVAAGQNLFILERAENTTTAITLSTTATSSTNSFTRQMTATYVLNGNDASTAQNSVRGAYHCMLPIGSVKLEGQVDPTTAGMTVAYDIHKIILISISDTTILAELDIFESSDEVTFTRKARSVTMSKDESGTAKGIVELDSRERRFSAGSGAYIRIGSNDVGASKSVEVKVLYHLYPTSLS